MTEYERVLEMLHDQFGWDLFNALTDNGKKLVKDTLDARTKIKNLNIPVVIKRKWYNKLFKDYIFGTFTVIIIIITFLIMFL